jgi:DNA polymerase-3 subunit chi
MPRADFYLIAKPRFLTEPLRLVCELARKANDAGLFTLVLARDRPRPRNWTNCCGRSTTMPTSRTRSPAKTWTRKRPWC